MQELYEEVDKTNYWLSSTRNYNELLHKIIISLL